MAPDTNPVVLFDGVCNLCNAWVRWLVRRDHRGELRYASLQSKAAHALLVGRIGEDGIAELPDAIVLVDQSGVHTRSTAVLRIARVLGLPWSAATPLLAVPVSIRDGVYRWVARNRYRWFGHRQSCTVPDPEVAQRFLDTDEARPVLEVAEPALKDGESPAAVRTWALRFVLVYLFLYMLPFPLTLLGNLQRLPLISEIPGLGPVLGAVLGAWTEATNALVVLVGSVVFDLETAPRMTGSGDQTFNYVELATDLGTAALVAFGWSVVARFRSVRSTTIEASQVLARYYLGWYLLIYGWVKIFPLQMPVPGPDRLLQPYGDSSPMGLAWTFIGASVGYQIFSGLAEVAAGYLLFFRRTARVGGLVAMAVMLNVMAINYFYDVPVKLFSTHLFLYGLFVAAPDLPRLVGFFAFALPAVPDRSPPLWSRWGWRPGRVLAANLALVALLTTFHVQDGLRGSRTRGILSETPSIEGVYTVASFLQDGLEDRENEDAARWVRVGINVPTATTIQTADGVAVRMLMALDTAEHTMSFFDRGASAPDTPQFRYTEAADGSVTLEGIFEDKPTRVLLRRIDTEPLLTGRGFRWINEFPFNR